mmetsp:Transcript_16332/g.44338  ORF Transcript_16332/g.44338 Transcript_16332/m.44338 type:complete len:103 (+) Transcript_16332:68-376(+)
MTANSRTSHSKADETETVVVKKDNAQKNDAVLKALNIKKKKHEKCCTVHMELRNSALAKGLLKKRARLICATRPHQVRTPQHSTNTSDLDSLSGAPSDAALL